VAFVLRACSRRKATEKAEGPKQTAQNYMNIAREEELEWATRYAVSFLDAGMMKRRVAYAQKYLTVRGNQVIFRFPCPMRHVSRLGSICAQFSACSHALVWTRPKTAFSAPHSTSSPHLAQTEQARLTRFFALPDPNTSPRVTISVWGHVVVSQMGIVQVPDATVTIKYFRALTYRHV